MVLLLMGVNDLAIYQWLSTRHRHRVVVPHLNEHNAISGNPRLAEQAPHLHEVAGEGSQRTSAKKLNALIEHCLLKEICDGCQEN